MKSTQFGWLLPLLTLALLSSPVARAAETQYVDVRQAAINFDALQPGQQGAVAVVLRVKDGFHIQSHTPSEDYLVRCDISLDKNADIKALDAVYPPPMSEKYSFSEKPQSVYTDTITVYLPYQVGADAKPGPMTIGGKFSYQACNKDGCFQPADVKFSLNTKIVALGEPIAAENGDLFKGLSAKVFTATAPATTANTDDGEKIFGRFSLKHDSYLLAFIAAFIAGIIFNAVPCVLPVLPLKAIGFYEVSQHNRARCLAYGAVFSLGLIASFAVLALLIVVHGKIAAHTGWGEIYSNVYFNAAIVVILLAMAIGTFGFFNVNLPVGIYRITPRHDTYLGNFLFGILTAVLSTPCTFGLFVTLLVWAAKQETIVGVALVMTVGAGMAFPYFLLSAFPELARRFPRTGPWSELVKQAMAFLLLGSAVFFARRFIQPYTGEVPFWWTLFAVAVLAGLFLIVRAIRITPNFTPRLVVTCIALLVVGVTYLLVRELMLQPFAWTPYSQEELSSAQDKHRVVVIDFTATWCSTCQYLETHTLHSPEVVKTVKSNNIQMLKADLTSENAVGWPLLKETAPPPGSIPFTLVYGPGVEMPIKLTGIYNPQALIEAIDKAGKKSVAIAR